MNELGVLTLFFLTVTAGILLAGYIFGGRTEKQAAESTLAEPEITGPQAFFAHAFRRVGENVPAAKTTANPMRKLLQAAGYRYPSAVPIFYGIQCATAFGFSAAVIGMAAVADSGLLSGLLSAGCAAAFGFLLPEMVLKRMITARRKRIRRAIPAALDLLVLSIEAGQSLTQAIVDTSAELRLAHPDLSTELWQVNLELRAGTSRADALRHLGARNGDPDLKKLAGLLVDSERFGTSLAPALRTHAKYLRTSMRQQAQEAARKVTVKLIFPVFFLIFPSVLLVTLGPAVLHMMKSFSEFVTP